MSIELLTAPHNHAVCKLTERLSPGLVYPGDSLSSLVGLLHRATKFVNTLPNLEEGTEGDDLRIDLYEALEKHVNMLGYYEGTCKKSGCSLPYNHNLLQNIQNDYPESPL